MKKNTTPFFLLSHPPPERTTNAQGRKPHQKIQKDEKPAAKQERTLPWRSRPPTERGKKALNQTEKKCSNFCFPSHLGTLDLQGRNMMKQDLKHSLPPCNAIIIERTPELSTRNRGDREGRKRFFSSISLLDTLLWYACKQFPCYTFFLSPLSSTEICCQRGDEKAGTAIDSRG